MKNLSCTMLSLLATLAGCLGPILSGSSHQEIQSAERDETERLIAVLQVPKIRETDPAKVTDAIKRLGQIGDERAIPILAEYLDFKRPPTDYEKAGLRLAGSMLPYPASHALDSIGRSATAAVVKILGREGIESVGGENAFWVLHYYYRNSTEEMLDLLELLEHEASSAPEGTARHLRQAITRYRELMKRE